MVGTRFLSKDLKAKSDDGKLIVTNNAFHCQLQNLVDLYKSS